MSAAVVVKASGLRKRYEGQSNDVFCGVDLFIARGEFIAIMGPSGSGKTTLLNCLSGIEVADEGSVSIGGKKIEELNENRRADLRASTMGFIFQGFNLLPILTVAENVEIPLLLMRVAQPVAREKAHQMLDRVGLAGKADRSPESLSIGEQQRVAVARALVHEPQIVWADEPTGSLDSYSTSAVVDLLAQLNSEGNTIVVVTHNPAVAEATTRVLQMSGGRLKG